MTLIDKIKKSVEGATGFPFLYHAAGEINELIARAAELPCAFAFCWPAERSKLRTEYITSA